MRVLIAYGSKMGGTHGLANWLGNDLQEMGSFEVDVQPADMVRSVDSYDAVIVGGALYIFRWHGDARSFVRRFRRELKEKPVWLFSSGPLDDSASHEAIPPVKGVAKIMEKIGARGHVTFGGRIPENAEGMAKKMAEENTGDWRDPTQVRNWAREIASELIPVG